MHRKRLCKGCDQYFRPPEDSPTIRHCSAACAEDILKKHWATVRAQQERARKKAQKAKKLQYRRERIQYTQDKLSHQFKLTQPIFNHLIVLLDKKEPCGSCGEWKCGRLWDCGHVKSVGSHPELRFDFLNAYKQGRRCNGGQRRLSSREKVVSKQYEERLIKTKGQAVVDYLNGPHKPKHYTREGLKELRAIFAAEIRYIEKHDNPSKNWRTLP